MRKLTTEEFIENARQIHGDKYDYSKVEYKTSGEKVCIICPKHGEFWMTPENHLHRTHPQNCPLCVHKSNKYTLEGFIEKAKEIHGDKYDYSKVEYVNKDTKICIICPKHGEFWQTPSIHINNKCGCPICKSSKLETHFANILKREGIEYIPQQKFCWLGRQSLDFYIPSKNIAIECQGEQHFTETSFGNSEELKHRLEYYKKLDIEKYEKCQEHGIEILYFSTKKYDASILSEDEILKKIKN